ncbi:MAG: hypothetical protein IJR99_09835 [Kiritimatiellae bacterium]|nr:hypothetical protein [Kiritimatiellia bacterium]
MQNTSRPVKAIRIVRHDESPCGPSECPEPRMGCAIEIGDKDAGNRQPSAD